MTKLIFALDVPDSREAGKWVRRLYGEVDWFKVGLELYLSEGRDVVSRIVDQGKNVFLDLKLHDVPATVARAVGQVAKTGASMTTVHATGGIEMMKAAAEAADGLDVVAVTVLTSMDAEALKEIRIRRDPKELAVNLAMAASVSGIRGVVSSPNEIRRIKNSCGEQFRVITPGIRMPDSPPDDQKRTATPGQAAKWGADFIVVGRPIRNAPDPLAMAANIKSMLG